MGLKTSFFRFELIKDLNSLSLLRKKLFQNFMVAQRHKEGEKSRIIVGKIVAWKSTAHALKTLFTLIDEFTNTTFAVFPSLQSLSKSYSIYIECLVTLLLRSVVLILLPRLIQTRKFILSIFVHCKLSQKNNINNNKE